MTYFQCGFDVNDLATLDVSLTLFDPHDAPFLESPAFPFRPLSEQELKKSFIDDADAWVDEVGQRALDFADAEPGKGLSRGEQEYEARPGTQEIFTDLNTQYKSNKQTPKASSCRSVYGLLPGRYQDEIL